VKYFSIVFLLTFFIGLNLFANPKDLKGTVIDSAAHTPVCGASVVLSPVNKGTVTDEAGRFSSHNTQSVNQIVITAVGYESKVINSADFAPGQIIILRQHQTQLAGVVVSAHTDNPYKAISETDIKMRGVSNSQEVLRIVPGLFIGQHQGGGKAREL